MNRACGCFRGGYHESSDPAGAVEDSQRLCLGAKRMQIDATPLAACGFADFAADPADGQIGDRAARAQTKKKGFSLIRMMVFKHGSQNLHMEGKTWNC